MAKNELSNKLQTIVKKLNSGRQWLQPRLPEFLIVVGLLSLTYTATHTYLRNQALRVNDQVVAEHSQQQDNNNNQPNHIVIPGLVDIAIQEEVYANGNWTIAEDQASYLSQSARPGEAGNIIVYGHNKREILGNIRAMGGNEIITLTTKDGVEHQYQVVEIAEVNPDEVSYLQPTEEETLTIYTCSGFMDKQRFIVQAKPVAQ